MTLNGLFFVRLALKFKEETDGMLGILFLSGLVSMVLYALAARADPGYLPLRLPGQTVGSGDTPPEVVHEWDRKTPGSSGKAAPVPGPEAEEGEQGGTKGSPRKGCREEGKEERGEGLGEEEEAEEREGGEGDPLLLLCGEEVREWARQRHCNICRTHVPIR